MDQLKELLDDLSLNKDRLAWIKNSFGSDFYSKKHYIYQMKTYQFCYFVMEKKYDPLIDENVFCYLLTMGQGMIMLLTFPDAVLDNYVPKKDVVLMNILEQMNTDKFECESIINKFRQGGKNQIAFIDGISGAEYEKFDINVQKERTIVIPKEMEAIMIGISDKIEMEIKELDFLLEPIINVCVNIRDLNSLIRSYLY